MSPTAAEPLEGFRVLDLTTFLSGPLATRSLAMMGATVVKIEPLTGDPTRAGWGRQAGEPPSPYWLALHRDRRSVVLDLKSDAGREVFLDLVERADALVDNFRAGVMGRLGLGPEVLHDRNPRLVSCSITGFGSDGPVAEIAAIDGPVQAFAGLLDLTGDGVEPGPPIPMQVADIAGAAHATQAVLGALLARERTGQGTHIDLSMAECIVGWLHVVDRDRGMRPPATLVLEASDGAHLLVQPIMHFHARFAELVSAVPGCEGFADDPRFADRDSRFANQEAYEEVVRRAVRTRTCADWLADLFAAGVPAAPVHLGDEVLDHPQFVHRGATAQVAVAGLGDTRVVASPFVFDGVRRTDSTPPPLLGEDTQAILAGWLDYSADRVAALTEAGVIGGPPTG